MDEYLKKVRQLEKLEEALRKMELDKIRDYQNHLDQQKQYNPLNNLSKQEIDQLMEMIFETKKTQECN